MGAAVELGVLLHEGHCLDAELLAEEGHRLGDRRAYRILYSGRRREHRPAHGAKRDRSNDHVPEVSRVGRELPQLLTPEWGSEEVKPSSTVWRSPKSAGVVARELASVVEVEIPRLDYNA